MLLDMAKIYVTILSLQILALYVFQKLSINICPIKCTIIYIQYSCRNNETSEETSCFSIELAQNCQTQIWTSTTQRL